MSVKESAVLRLALLVLLGFFVFSLPSYRQCQHYPNNATIQAQCAENRKHVATYMPSEKAIYFESNKPKLPNTPRIPYHFFHNCKVDSHRDVRFGKDIVIPIRNRALMNRRLLSAFLEFTNEFKLKWWMAHGALIGWYYNEELLPWDSDFDVKVLYYDFVKYYTKLNGHVHKNRYLFEVNPNHYYRGISYKDFIDARFIDRTNGLYVDITGMIYIPEKKLLACKSPRYYTVEDLFPLRNSSFMGYNNVWFPNNPTSMMEKDYGKHCMEMKNWAKTKELLGVTYNIDFYRWSEEGQEFITDPNPPSWRSALRKRRREHIKDK